MSAIDLVPYGLLWSTNHIEAAGYDACLCYCACFFACYNPFSIDLDAHYCSIGTTNLLGFVLLNAIYA